MAAGLEKVKSQSAYTTVKLAADNGLTAASDELLFSQSTIEQADGGTVTATQNDDTFVDVTSTGTVNLRSGEATVSAGAKFTVGGAGVNADDDTKVDGGYAVSSSAEYTVKAADNSSPFNGKASLKASAAGQTFKVTEPDGKTVSYKATNAGDVFYLGRYSTDYSGVSEGALVTKPESGDPWQGSEYSVTFTPNVGYGNLSVKAVDKNGKETDLTLTSATSSKARAAAQATVTEDANAGTMTVTVSNVQSNLKFAVGKFAHYATVTYKPNGADGDGADAVRTVDGGDETEFTGTLVNPFTKDDWTLMGWSEVQDGTSGVFHNASGTVSLKDGGNLDVYAVWHKANEASGSITLPGKDGKPDTGSDDVTIKQGTGADDTKPVVKAGDKEGYVEAPTNSTITRAGNSAITVNKGPVKVYPNGKIVVPEGSKITLSDGSVAEGLVTIDPDGKSDKPVRNNDGSIVLPGADKQTGDDDDVSVTPSKNGSTDSSTIDKNGNVTLPDGGKVTYPAAADGNAQVVTVPKSTTVSSDGSLTIPEGKTGTLSLGGTVVPGGSSINAAGEVTYRFTIKYVDEEANSAEAAIATTALVAAKGGDELVQTEHMMVPEAELPKSIEAIEIEDYKPNQATQQLETGTDASAYTVSFSYVSVSAAREVLQEEAKQIESYIDAQQHLSAEQKAALKADLVKTTLDGSVSNTNKATTGGDVTQAKADGVEALEQLKQQIELAEQRAASSQDLSGYASNKADAIAGLDGLSQEEIASYKARIDSEVAGGDASISKAEQADIDPANQSARVQIDKIVAEAKAQAEANIRSSAEADLDAKAEQAKKQVDALQEIDQAAKDKAKAEIEQACDLAKAKIDQASDTQQVQTEQQAGVKTIDEIVSGVVAENTAVLDEAKSDAIKELKAKASEVDKLIDAKQYLSEAQQRELHERVASTLEEYIAKVNAAESAEGVGEAKLAGLEALEAISADATRLDEEAAASRAKASSTSAKTATAGHAVDVDTLSNTGGAVESLALLVVFSVLLGASLTLLRRHA